MNHHPMLQAYFANKNYVALYAHSFFDHVAGRLAEIFTGVYLYSAGMPLHFVLLYWGMEFGLRGALAPLGPLLLSRIGLTKTILVSYVLFLAYFVIVGSAPFSLGIAFSSFIFHSFAKAMYCPCVDALHSVLVHDANRGRQNSLELVLTSVASLLAVGLGTLVLSYYSFFVMVAAVALLLTFALHSASRLSLPGQAPLRFRDSYNYLTSKPFRPYLIPLAAYSLVIIANIEVAPLFVFIRMGRIETFGAVLGATFAVQFFLTLLWGDSIDRWKSRKSASVASILQALGNIAYLFMGTNPVRAFVVNAYNSTVWNLVRNSFETRNQTEANRDSSPFLFMAGLQMALCFTEIVALVIFALIAFFDPELSFIVVFLASVIGLFVAERTLFGRAPKS